MIAKDGEPNILELVCKSLDTTIYCTKWIPGSARIVVLGAHTKGTGALEVIAGRIYRLCSEFAHPRLMEYKESTS